MAIQLSLLVMFDGKHLKQMYLGKLKLCCHQVFVFFKLRKEWGFSKEVQVPHSSPAEVK